MIKRVVVTLIFSVLILSSCATGIVKVSKLGDLPPEIDTKNLPDASQYPDSDGVILYENTVYDVDYVRGVGVETYITVHKIYKVFRNEESFMRNYLSFDRKTVFESFSGRTIKPDGTSIDLKEEDVYVGVIERNNKEFKASFYFAEYNMPKIRKGDIVEIKYTSINRYFYFADTYWAQHRLPKKYSRFEISIPNFVFDDEWAYKFDYKVKNLAISDPVFKQGFGDYSDRSYVWENRDIPAFEPETASGPDYLYRGHIDIQLASWKTWNGYARDHYERNYEPVIDKMSKKEKELIKSKAEELTKGLTNQIDKIKALKKFVQTFHYSDTAVYFGHHVKPNSIETILNREYGDCKDHTALLTVLLRETGMKAWPALIRSDDPIGVDTKFVTDIFNHVIVKVTLDGGQVLWLDPTYKFAPFGKLTAINEDTYVLEMRPKKEDKDVKMKLEKTPVSNYSDNLIEKRVSGRIETGIAKYDVVVKMTGNEAVFGRYLFENISDKDLEKGARITLPSFLYDAKIGDIKIENMYENELPLFIKYSVEYDPAEKWTTLFPVRLFRNQVWPNWIYNEKRTRPVFLEKTYSTREIYEFTYDPEKYSVINFSEEINREISDESGISLKTKAENTPGKITVTFDFAQKNKIVPVENIPQMLKNSVEINKQLLKTVSIRPVLKEAVSKESAVEIDSSDMIEEPAEETISE
ncbi:MAG TPA: DUF3857 domain-containing protein [bacterium]|nr:DUF3857 domain-containing protein [bacterium]